MPKRILIADDDDAILDALSLVLEDEGHEVSVTTSPLDILSSMTPLPDVILLDIWMSGINGADVCNELKQNPRTKDIPVILVSANRDAKRIAEDVGADACILKPFEVQDLLDSIDSVTRKD